MTVMGQACHQVMMDCLLALSASQTDWGVCASYFGEVFLEGNVASPQLDQHQHVPSFGICCVQPEPGGGHGGVDVAKTLEPG